MKAIPSPNLALKLAPNDNYFIEELAGILWIEFKLFVSKWKRFSPAKAKKPSLFFTSLDESVKANLSQKAMKLAPNDNYFTE